MSGKKGCEGNRRLEIKKIEVFRTSLKKDLLCLNDRYIRGIVCDQPNKEIINTGLPYFKFNETTKILNFINIEYCQLVIIVSPDFSLDVQKKCIFSWVGMLRSL